MRRHTTDDYRRLAAERGYTWLDAEAPRTNATKTRWQCSQGHIWETSYNTLQQGGSCPQCSRETGAAKRRHTTDDYRRLAAERGYTWLDAEAPRTSKTKTRWQCPQGHEWIGDYQSLHRGHGCSVCGYERVSAKIRITPEQVTQVAASRGFKWLGNTHPYAQEATEWQCSKGHIWKATYNDVRKGNGCPYCSHNAPLTAGGYARAARERGFIWLGPFPSRIHDKTRWQCPQGHEWEAPYSNVVHNQTGCPKCREFVNGQRTSRIQRQLHDLIGGELNHPFDRYHIDIAFVADKIAIEYDCWYWHQGKATYERKRDAFMQSAGWKIIRIKAGQLLPTLEQVQAALNRLRQGEQYVEIILADWRET